MTRPVTLLGLSAELPAGTHTVAVRGVNDGPLLAGTEESGRILATLLVQ